MLMAYVWGAGVLMLHAALIYLTFLIPRMESETAKLKVELPTVTKFWYSLGHACAAGWGFLVITPIALAMATGAILLGRRLSKGGYLVAVLLSFALWAGVVLSIVLGLFLPIVDVMLKLSESGK
jgi:type II secretory pathway component PulF